MLIDTHCHLNDRNAFPDPAAIVAESREAGVERLIVVGTDVESSRYALELADRFEGVYAVVGLHPNEAAKFEESTVAEIERLYGHQRAIALGEIGLDYHWDYATRDEQFRALDGQLDLAERLDAPTVFHCREAYDDLLDILEERKSPRLLLHCFGGAPEHLEKALALGAMIGVDGPITYPKADSLRETIKLVPRDRLLLETDAPWMSPHPFRGRPNHPCRLHYIRDAVAMLWDTDSTTVAKTTTENANRFFGLT
ncbi:MAG: D-aminoacyl-tRNA deacylase [Fimbriimonadaceae bacterium]|nr:D-aminoacyl-tRNA deacylase [Fimbriimonadaceae bacterium]